MSRITIIFLGFFSIRAWFTTEFGALGCSCRESCCVKQTNHTPSFERKLVVRPNNRSHFQTVLKKPNISTSLFFQASESKELWHTTLEIFQLSCIEREQAARYCVWKNSDHWSVSKWISQRWEIFHGAQNCKKYLSEDNTGWTHYLVRWWSRAGKLHPVSVCRGGGGKGIPTDPLIIQISIHWKHRRC